MSGNIAPLFFQCLRQCAIIERGQPSPGNEDHIDSRQVRARPPERFSGHTLESVSLNTQTYMLLGDHQPETRLTHVVSPDKQRKRRMAECPGLVENMAEITRFEKACGLGKTGSVRPVYGVSRARPRARRALMTFRPPTVRILALKPCVRTRFRLLG